MKILILGAGNCQLNAIKRIQSLGHEAFVSDYSLTSPGKKIADQCIMADTFSPNETLLALKGHTIDGVMTTGTDQPVYTVSVLAEALDLPCFLSSDIARHVTNKSYMKEKFTALGLPTAPYIFIDETSSAPDFSPPYVLKPIDSQGQRGIFKLDSWQDVKEHLKQTLSYSKASYALLEKFYENKEVTVSGWVDHGRVEIFMVTDRVTFDSQEHLGVCVAHEYPSIHQNKMDKIIALTHDICRGFSIDNGPIYFQFLIGEEGVFINEIACRLGGAYEDVTIPWLTDVPVLDKVVDGALGLLSPIKSYQQEGVFSTQLFFCKSGKVDDILGFDEIMSQSFILDAGVHYQVGDDIPCIENASQRGGYMIIVGDNEMQLKQRIQWAYDTLKIMCCGENLIIKGRRYYR